MARAPSDDDLLMVPNSSERRHRIQDSEVPEIVAGLRLRLREHLETKDDLCGASIAFRTLFRFEIHKVGKPRYPNPLTWDLIDSHVNGAISRVRGKRIRVQTSENQQILDKYQLLCSNGSRK